jgi:hypothetical protein
MQKGDDDAITNFLFADLYDFLRAFLMGNWGLHPGAWREAQAQLTTVQSLASRVSEQVRSAREGFGAGGPRDSEPKRQPERQPAKQPERQLDTQPQSAAPSDGPGADQRLHSDFQRLRAFTTPQGRESKPQSRSPAAPTAAAAVNAPAAIAHFAVSPSAEVKNESTSVRGQPVSSQKPDEPQPRGEPAEPDANQVVSTSAGRLRGSGSKAALPRQRLTCEEVDGDCKPALPDDHAAKAARCACEGPC